jgi:hypothetical protein
MEETEIVNSLRLNQLRGQDRIAGLGEAHQVLQSKPEAPIILGLATAKYSHTG